MNSILITKSLYSRHRAEDKILIGFIIYLAQIIAFVLLLGSLKILTFLNLILITIFFSLIILVTFRGRIHHPFFSRSDYIREAFMWTSKHRLLTVSISILLGFSLVKILYNLINPPFLWGSIVYHFTFPVEWIKNANLINPTVLFYVPALSYIAMNAEFFFFWLMIPLKNVFIADISCFLFYIMGIVACFAIMRKLGVAKEIAVLSGILFAITPQYFKHLLFNGNDIIVASLFLVALNLILLLKKRISLKNIAIAAIAMGLLLGTKSNALVWVLSLLPLVMYLILRDYLQSRRFSNFIFFGVAFVALILIFGGFTYIRNLIETGNPLYPLNYELFGIRLKGPIEYLNLRDHITLSNIDLGEMLFHQSLGTHFVLIAFPALFLSLPVLLVRSKFRLPFDMVYLLVLPLIMVSIFYAIAPFHTPSYMYHIVALGTLIGIYTLTQFKISVDTLRVIIFLLILAATTELTGHMMLVYSLLLSGLIFIGFTPVKNRNLWKIYRAFGTLLLLVLLIGLIPLEHYYEETKYENYAKTFHWEKDLVRAWQWVYGQTRHSPKNIAYTGPSAIFPLYGRKFRNNVYYTSVNKKKPYLQNFSKYYHLRSDDFQGWLDMMRQDGCMREGAEFNTWLENLRQMDTDLLFITCTDDFKAFPIEDRWATRHPGIFKLVLTNKRVRIYEILKK